MNITVTALLLFAAAGWAISLACSFIPGLRVKWAALAPDVKRFVMALVMLAISVVLFTAGCFHLVGLNFACTVQGALSLAVLYVWALMNNQTAYSVSTLPADVKRAQLLSRTKAAIPFVATVNVQTPAPTTNRRTVTLPYIEKRPDSSDDLPGVPGNKAE